MRSTIGHIMLALLFGVTAAACSAESSQPERALEDFLEALTNKDEALMISYTCPDYELGALLEYDAYALVKTSLENLSCQGVSQDNGVAQVSCQGSIEAAYGNEQRSFDLSDRTYQIINDSDSWLVCGYSK